MGKHASPFSQQSVAYGLAHPGKARLSKKVRARRLWIIGAVITLYVLVLSFSLMIAIRGSHVWGVHTQPSGGTWQIIWADRGLAVDYNLVVGDQIILANGHTPLSDLEINQADTLMIRTATGPRTIHWVPPDVLILIGWLSLGLACLIPGVLVFLHATERLLAWRFLLLWSALGLASTAGVAELYGDLLALHLVGLLFVGVAAGTMTNVIWLLVFPTRQVRRPHQQTRHRWLPELPLLTGAAFIIVDVFAIFLQNPSLLQADLMLGGIQTACCLVLALIFVLWVSWSRRANEARERARTLLLGLLLGMTPPLVLTILPQTFTGVPFVAGEITTLVIVILPFTFAYAAVRRELVHLDALIRRTAQLILSIIGTLTIAVLIAQGLILLPPILALLLALVAGGILIPLMFVIARWLTETWLFPQVKRYRKLLAETPTQAGATDPRLLAQQLIARVRLAQLPVAAVSVFVWNPSGEYTALAPLTEGEAPEVMLAASTLELDHELFLWLNRRGKPTLVQPLPTQNDPSGSLPAVKNATLPPDLGHQQPSSAQPWALLVPIRVYDHTVALLALSEREDTQPFAPGDIRVCSLIASQYAVPLEFALSHDALQAVQETKERLEEWKDALMTSASSALLTPLSLLQRQLADLTRIAPEQIRQQPTLVAQEVLRLWQEARQLDQTAKHWQEELELHQDRDLQLQNVEVSAVIGQVVEAMLARAAEKRIMLRNLIPKPTPRWVVLADPTALYRVLQRLLNNAIKASPPEGRIHLLAKEVYRSNQPSLVQIIVQDAGGPLARDTQYLLFERYAQVDGERDNLASAQQVIQSMRGDMGIDNDERRALVSCWINLPLAALDLPTSSEGPTSQGSPGTSTSQNGKRSHLSTGERDNHVSSRVNASSDFGA